MKEAVSQFLQKSLALLFEPVIEVPTAKEFGHYSTNVALRMAKERHMAPLAIAKEYAAKLIADDQDPSTGSGRGRMFSKIEAVPPGFINFWLAPEFLQKELAKAAKQSKKFGASNVGKGRIVIVDHAATNIAKPMHVGHLRSTIIGAALSNIHEALGYKVIRWNYLGDWGTQFGKLIAAYKMWGNKKEVEADPIKALLALYVRFHDEAKIKPELERIGQEEFRKLEAGDKENRKLWHWFKKESLLEFQKMFAILGVRFDTEVGEAYYEKELHSIVHELRDQQIAQESQGAIIVPLDKAHLPPAMIKKTDGATLYITRDIASLQHRLREFNPDKILYVVANQQALHFEQLFAIAKLLGLTSAELVHVKFGMVLGADGKKLATREGKVVELASVINEAIKRARAIVEQKNAKLPEQEKRAISRSVAIGAIKYNDLKENRNSDITFNWDSMLDLHGDSAPYLQYTFTRLQSILKKSEIRISKSETKSVKFLNTESELSLIKKILDFPDVLQLCADSYYTSHLAKYLYELAKLANQFYESTPILSDTNRARCSARLLLIGTVAQTLQNGLKLLGIETVERI